MELKTKNQAIRNAITEPCIPYQEVPVEFLKLEGNRSEYNVFPRIGELVSDEDFYRFQHETSQVIDNVKDKAIQQYTEQLQGKFEGLNSELFHLHESRVGKVRNRGTFSRICNLALGGKEDELTPIIAGSVEFILEHMYYLNQVFDSKSNPDIPRNHVASVISKSLSYNLLKEQPHLKKELDNILSAFDWGEYFDCNFNNWEKLKDNSLEDRIRSCNTRTYYINGFFYQAIAHLALLDISKRQNISVNNEQFNNLSRYAHNYGMGMMVANDISDFVFPELNRGTSEKTPQDSYSDIKNAKMTYPIIAMLEMASPEDRNRVITCLENGFKTSPGELKETTRIFLRSGAYNACKSLAGKYKIKASQIAHSFPSPVDFLLSRTAIMLTSNRYYSALNQINCGIGGKQ